MVKIGIYNFAWHAASDGPSPIAPHPIGQELVRFQVIFRKVNAG
jgi:hypothetical protein